ncbi:DsbA family protein [Microbacterium ulmi]|uniref:DsbA family protein n=1 Tax=Microbacterium ulmi TaxID=179095 RepID=UPI0031332DE9|nr:protein-disulfide isomerase [Microbacterium ulmi]
MPEKRDRREAVREKAQLVQAQQSRARAIRRGALATGIVAVVAVAAVVVTWVVGSAVSKPMLTPANSTHDGFAVTAVTGVAATAGLSGLGDPTPTPTPVAEEPTPDPTETQRGAVDIRVYVDYLSPQSRDFQVANAQQLASWVDQDAATLTYYPVAMLTSKSNGTKYSLRAASAAACVASFSRDSFFAFNHALLTQQPTVDSDGLDDKALADLAIASGAESPKTVRSCIQDETYATWAKGATERALKGLPDTDGAALTGAPMVLVNGKTYVGALDDAAEFAQFVLTIASDDYYVTPSPTPSTTP